MAGRREADDLEALLAHAGAQARAARAAIPSLVVPFLGHRDRPFLGHLLRTLEQGRFVEEAFLLDLGRAIEIVETGVEAGTTRFLAFSEDPHDVSLEPRQLESRTPDAQALARGVDALRELHRAVAQVLDAAWAAREAAGL